MNNRGAKDVIWAVQKKPLIHVVLMMSLLVSSLMMRWITIKIFHSLSREGGLKLDMLSLISKSEIEIKLPSD